MADMIQPPGSITSVTQGTAAHFLHHPYLNMLNLVVNAEFHFLVCQLCQEAILATAGRGHIKNKHKELLTAYNKEKYSKAIIELDVASLLPSNIEGPRPAVHGLRLENALACERCSTVMANSKSMREHHLVQHKGMSPPTEWKKCKAQRLKREGGGSVRTFWRVIEDAESVDESDGHELRMLLSDLDKELKNVTVPVDHRLVSPWLQSTNWHKYVAKRAKGMSVNQVRNLVALPQRHEVNLEGLHHAVKSYFEEALALIDTMDELVLQYINSPDPTK